MELYGKTFSEDHKNIIVRRIYCAAMEQLRKLSSESDFYKRYWEYGSVPTMFKNANHDLYHIFLQDAIQYILNALPTAKIYDFDTARIIKMYSKYAIHYLSACADVYAEYCEIQGDYQAAKQARSRAKENRGRFVGGGFGISGAAKGIAMAGAANLATGAIYSAGNLIGNAISQASAINKSDKLYDSPNTVKKLHDALCQDFLMGVDVLEEILVSKWGNSYANPLDQQRLDRANAIMKNIEAGIIPKEDQKKTLVETMINDAPFYDKIYLFAYEKFGDDKGQLFEFAKFFGKNDIVDRIKQRIEEKKSEEAQEAAERSFLGDNFDIVQTAITSGDGKFFDYAEYYIYATLGKYLCGGYTYTVKKLIDDRTIPQSLQEDLTIFDILPEPERNKKIQEYKTLCDANDIFESDEKAYLFINRSAGVNIDKGFLITSKGIYFSAKCKSAVPLMRYDKIDGIVKGDCGQSDIIYDKRSTFIFAGLGFDVSCLLTLTVLFFKYGDSKITGKTTSKLSDSEVAAKEKIEQKERETNQRTDKAADIAVKLFLFLILVGIIVLVCKMCGV